MVNHVYTLLMNEPYRETRLLLQPPVQSDYEPRELTSYLQNIYAAIFGTEPDYDGKSITAHRLLSVLHSPEVEPLTLEEDSRITYNLDVELPQIFSERRSFCSKVRSVISTPQRAIVLGRHNADETGRMTLSYRVTRDDDFFFIKEMLWSNHPATREQVLPDANGFCTVNLPGGSYRLVIKDTDEANAWLIDGRTIPSRNLSLISQRLRQQASDVALLAASVYTPHLQRIKEWLLDGKPLELQIAAVLLLLAKAIEGSSRRQ